ncbi:MAG TPA: hypothetical protein VNE62_12810 [Actinomycetota bacterium]|nr:hypothetical protein [Actinomycetota bacterium]
MKKLAKIAVGLAIVAGTVGAGGSAQAYCQPEPVAWEGASSNGCSNSCEDTSKLWDRIFGPGFWACPQ